MSEDKARLWIEYLPVVQNFFEHKPIYEALCSEISFILAKRLLDEKIEVAAITSRVKTLDSILKKIERKNYQEPLKQTTDIAGVRVVFLYRDDLNKIKSIVKRNFEVIEEVDKSTLEVDRFGYGALHYVVRILKKTSGARYEDLKDLVCEIQVRTILQDSWAVINHHLMYKTEAQIPKALRRKIHRLAAKLEEADEQFNEVSRERNNYISLLRDEHTKVRDMLDVELNLDSLLVYLKKKFPSYSLAAYDNHVDAVIEGFDFDKYKTIRDIDKILNKTRIVRRRYNAPSFSKTALSHFLLALACVDSDYREKTSNKTTREAKLTIKEYIRGQEPSAKSGTRKINKRGTLRTATE